MGCSLEGNASTWRWINLFSFIATAVCNGLSAAGAFGYSQGEVSERNTVYLTPAGWAFSIWSVIYSFQALILIWGPCCCRLQDSAIEAKIFGPEGLGYYYLLLSIFNSAWCIVWSYDTVASMWICLFLIIGLWSCLIKIWLNINDLLKEDTLNVQKNQAGQSHQEAVFDCVSKYSLWIGFALYAGWTTTATALNLTLAINKVIDEEWSLETWNEIWSIVVCVLLGITYLYTGYKYRDPIFTLVGAWAFAAISDEVSAVSGLVELGAMITSAVLGVGGLFGILYGCLMGGFEFFFPAAVLPIRDGESAVNLTGTRC